MPRRTCWLLLCLSVISCGGGDTPGSDQGSAIPISGNERLAWEQPVESAATAKSYTYLLYIDNTAHTLTEASCGDERQPGGYACSSQLPSMSSGRHRLELAASLNGSEGSRSAPLFVDKGAAAASVPPSSAAPQPSGVSTSACLQAGSAGCFVNRLVASTPGSVSAIVHSAERGVTFFVEDESHLRLVTGDRILPDPVLSVSGPGVRMIDVALAADFPQTGRLFTAWSVLLPDGSESLSLTRYRELEGRLGEAATLVTGIRVPAGSAVQIGADDRGRIYVALPAGAAYSPVDGTGPAGAVLRFDGDGTAADTNPRSSPVLSGGYAHPTELLWDAGTRRVWLSGSDPSWPAWVSVLAVDEEPGAGTEWPRSIEAVVEGEASPQGSSFPSSMALTASPSSPPSLWLLLAERGAVLHAFLGIDGAIPPDALEPTEFQALGMPRAIGGVSTSGLLLATGSVEAGAPSSLWELSQASLTIP